MLILERIDESSTLYEEDSGTVFLAKDVVQRVQKTTERWKGEKERRRSRRISYPASGR
jgi:hypothetical protein